MTVIIWEKYTAVVRCSATGSRWSYWSLQPCPRLTLCCQWLIPTSLTAALPINITSNNSSLQNMYGNSNEWQYCQHQDAGLFMPRNLAEPSTPLLYVFCRLQHMIMHIAHCRYLVVSVSVAVYNIGQYRVQTDTTDVSVASSVRLSVRPTTQHCIMIT